MANILDKFFINFGNKTYEVNKKEQRKEYALTKNLYTLLGFKDTDDFENQVNKKLWQSFIDSSVKNLDCDNRDIREVVKNIIRCIAQSDKTRKNTIEKQLTNLENNKKVDEAKNKITKILKKIDVKEASNEVLTIKKQAEEFIAQAKKDKQKNEEKAKNLREKIKNNSDSINNETKTLEEIRQEQRKISDKFGLSGAALFEKTFEYIESLEKLEQNSITDFLRDQINASKKQYPNLHCKMEDAIKILSDSELRGFYNQNVEKGTLPLIVSYKECKTQFDKVELEKIDKLVELLTKSINYINKNKVSIFHCKETQNEHLKEKETFEHRGRYCQNMIDILQENIQKYQKEIDSHFNPIRETLDTISPKTRDSHEMREFLSKLDNLQTNHGNLLSKVQINEEFKQMLTCLASMQNKTYVELEKTNLSGNLSSIDDLKIEYNKGCTMRTRL
ncbi:hypothetical protein [Wolbachia endosymbiont of Chironomus riparius]|uniref:hypothetical protein n=1 Tax=Wolbachia endosymbiont of Chironomus riparius TaxID=2883238 RepID=UPI00209D455C|nr:hypothetical protein [Wolbachia endosymbiont of Chironomus riparius]